MLPELIDRIEEKIKVKWSPEQISNRFRKENTPTVSAETIYQHIY
jgi:IS30 family transposase